MTDRTDDYARGPVALLAEGGGSGNGNGGPTPPQGVGPTDDGGNRGGNGFGPFGGPEGAGGPSRTGWIYFAFACILLGYTFWNLGGGLRQGDKPTELVAIQLAEVPLDACLGDMLQLERETRERLVMSRPGFDPDIEGLWRESALAASEDAGELTARDPEVIGWLHTVEALAQGCIFTARYRAAASYARTVMRAHGYPNLAVGTLFLALARLEDEDGFFAAARDAGEGAEDLPWFLLGRTILLYKLGQRRSARRALRDFAARCDGGAFFLINPTYHDPYLPVRPAALEAWDLSHQAVWEADGIIADTPDFAACAEGVEGIRERAEEFALRHGF